ncbi:MAG TPA: arginine--tRNA ligase [Buchnera sp. (in: enterobacteria)]|nr:arginine--tRNA ligase [Buchnera sp. (in: enterobacteria)]
MNIQDLIAADIKKSLVDSGITITIQPTVHRTKNLKLGHYQSNTIIKIANILKKNAYQLSQIIVNNMKKKYIYEKIEIAKPGFINFFLKLQWLSTQLEESLYSSRLNISIPKPQTIVIDYSSPNIAKEMHVGHLRSTIIGDATARMLEFLGHNVIRVNHIGDWGMQFGMLIAYLEKYKDISLTNNVSLLDLENVYKKSKKKYDTDILFKALSRKYLIKLQTGDEYCRKIWNNLITITLKHNEKIYNKLDVTLKNIHIMGESSYNNILPNIVDDLIKKNIATSYKGSIIVFLEEFKNRNNKTMGVIIQKQDTGYLYSTIDIACIKYRCEILHPDKILYYTDSRQYQYLKQIQKIAKKAGYIPDHVNIEHHIFGMILSKNRRPFKTRLGKNIKLYALLEEGVKRAKNIIRKKNPYLSETKICKLANIIGIGAIKYADLSKNRITDYIFNWDQMLSFEGNTAPYIQYAYARIMSIFKKSKHVISKSKYNIYLSEKYEIELALTLLQFEETIFISANQGTPHIMCNYLYKLSVVFSSFYENCSILFSTTQEVLHSRLKLSSLTAKTIQVGLYILGINTVHSM